MSPPLLALGCIALPVLASVLIVATGRTPNLREAVTLAAGALVIGCVLGLYPEVSQGARPDVVLCPRWCRGSRSASWSSRSGCCSRWWRGSCGR